MRAAEVSLEPGQRLQTVTDGRPELSSTLQRAEQFLALVLGLGFPESARGGDFGHHAARPQAGVGGGR